MCLHTLIQNLCYLESAAHRSLAEKGDGLSRSAQHTFDSVHTSGHNRGSHAPSSLHLFESLLLQHFGMAAVLNDVRYNVFNFQRLC